MAIIGTVLSVACSLYTLVLLARVILDWARFFAPRWRPTGVILLFANLVYGLTDPPLRWLRRFIPPLRLGNVALDVGFIVLFLGVALLGRVASYLIYFGR